jgi:hypothetical protein
MLRTNNFEDTMTPSSPRQHNQKNTFEGKLNLSDEIPPTEAALYITEMLLELRNMAKAARLKQLLGLLELAYYEAFNSANRQAIPEGEVERLEQMGEDARRAEAE